MNFWDGITARCYYNYRVCGVDRLTLAVVTRQLNVVGGTGGAARYNGACARPEDERESEYAPGATWEKCKVVKTFSNLTTAVRTDGMLLESL